MTLLRISLPTFPPHDFRVAEIDGAGELLADPGDPGSVRAIILHVVRDAPDGWLGRLPIAIFDRLCATIFASLFGDSADCRSDCRKCGESFTFQFDISELISIQDVAAEATGLTLGTDGCWSAKAGLSIRPPTLGDLDQNASPEMLRRSLVTKGDATDSDVEQLIEAASPLLTLSIGTQCPHCDEPQEVGFDMAGYLVASIGAERAFLIRETHLLASRYGWTRESIMALPRGDRRAYAALIESERSAALSRRSA